jgi:ankyrin repeat protein
VVRSSALVALPKACKKNILDLLPSIAQGKLLVTCKDISGAAALLTRLHFSTSCSDSKKPLWCSNQGKLGFQNFVSLLGFLSKSGNIRQLHFTEPVYECVGKHILPLLQGLSSLTHLSFAPDALVPLDHDRAEYAYFPVASFLAGKLTAPTQLRSLNLCGHTLKTSDLSKILLHCPKLQSLLLAHTHFESMFDRTTYNNTNVPAKHQELLETAFTQLAELSIIDLSGSNLPARLSSIGQLLNALPDADRLKVVMMDGSTASGLPACTGIDDYTGSAIQNNTIALFHENVDGSCGIAEVAQQVASQPLWVKAYCVQAICCKKDSTALMSLCSALGGKERCMDMINYSLERPNCSIRPFELTLLPTKTPSKILTGSYQTEGNALQLCTTIDFRAGMKHLLELGADKSGQESAFVIAARKGNIAAARLLKEYSCDVNANAKKAIAAALEHGNGKIAFVNFLLDECDVPAKTAIVSICQADGIRSSSVIKVLKQCKSLGAATLNRCLLGWMRNHSEVQKTAEEDSATEDEGAMGDRGSVSAIEVVHELISLFSRNWEIKVEQLLLAARRNPPIFDLVFRSAMGCEIEAADLADTELEADDNDEDRCEVHASIIETDAAKREQLRLEQLLSHDCFEGRAEHDDESDEEREYWQSRRPLYVSLRQCLSKSNTPTFITFPQQLENDTIMADLHETANKHGITVKLTQWRKGQLVEAKLRGLWCEARIVNRSPTNQLFQVAETCLLSGRTLAEEGTTWRVALDEIREIAEPMATDEVEPQEATRATNTRRPSLPRDAAAVFEGGHSKAMMLTELLKHYSRQASMRKVQIELLKLCADAHTVTIYRVHDYLTAVTEGKGSSAPPMFSVGLLKSLLRLVRPTRETLRLIITAAATSKYGKSKPKEATRLIECVERILVKARVHVDARTKESEGTLLELVCQQSAMCNDVFKKLVKLLIDNGASIDGEVLPGVINQQRGLDVIKQLDALGQGQTALHAVIKLSDTSKASRYIGATEAAGRAEKAEYITKVWNALKDSNDVNAQDEEKNTPLHVAVAQNNKAYLKQLLAMPLIALNMPNTKFETPLAIAITSAYFDIAKLLLQSPNVLLSNRDAGGNTYLHLFMMAVRRVPRGHDADIEEVCRLLIGGGMSAEEENKDGVTGLQIAAQEHQHGWRGRWDKARALEVLLKCTGNTGLSKALAATDTLKNTALHLACSTHSKMAGGSWRRRDGGVSKSRRLLDTFGGSDRPQLLKSTAAQNIRGQTPFHMLAGEYAQSV